MGCLRRHELTGYIKDYGLEYYFETGTGQAEALQHAVKYPFKKCYTVDIDEDMVEYSYNKLKNESTCDIEFLVGKSTEALDEHVPELPKMLRLFSFWTHTFLEQIFISVVMKNRLESTSKMPFH